MFEIFDASMKEKFEEYLNAREIEYQKASTEGGFSFAVAAKDSVVASEAFKAARENR